jgi:hypothetical protein
VEPSPERIADTGEFSLALRGIVEFIELHGLPMTAVTVHRNHRVNNYGQRGWAARPGFVPDGEIVMWAQALGVYAIRVEDGGHCTYIRIRHDAVGLAWEVDAAITKPANGGPQLGGVRIDWDRDRQGKRAKSGVIRVGDLAEGLSRMGISVVSLKTGPFPL